MTVTDTAPEVEELTGTFLGGYGATSSASAAAVVCAKTEDSASRAGASR